MPLHCIVPPYMLRSIFQHGTPAQQSMAWATLTASEQIRGQRRVMAALSSLPAATPGRKRRTVYDARGDYDLPGRLVRSEGSPRGKDTAANEAYSGSGATYDFFWKVYGRNSIDGRGMRLDSTVHFGKSYDNALPLIGSGGSIRPFPAAKSDR